MATPFQGAPEATLAVEIDVSELTFGRFDRLASWAAGLFREVNGEAFASGRRRSPGPPPLAAAPAHRSAPPRGSPRACRFSPGPPVASPCAGSPMSLSSSRIAGAVAALLSRSFRLR